ncbi:MAG TPA: Rieske 2Fe-2S domain-containing protein [Gammaproteobacteria bacterium]|nr:Rieske 2Fe-2S domain-containing protein [Gammaproteobacteria bacterium]
MERRRLLTGLCALGVGTPRIGRAQASAPPDASAPPREDDRLVFAYGDRAGQVVEPGDLAVGSRQVFAFPMDPVAEVVRNANRLNQIVVVRLDPGWLSEETRARSADGIVAYSGVCTHTGCDIDIWVEEQNRLQCMCHESQFDPADAARVVGGPAPSQLAALPLKLVEGRLAVAGPFFGRVGFQQPGLDPFGL